AAFAMCPVRLSSSLCPPSPTARCTSVLRLTSGALVAVLRPSSHPLRRHGSCLAVVPLQGSSGGPPLQQRRRRLVCLAVHPVRDRKATGTKGAEAGSLHSPAGHHSGVV